MFLLSPPCVCVWVRRNQGKVIWQCGAWTEPKSCLLWQSLSLLQPAAVALRPAREAKRWGKQGQSKWKRSRLILKRELEGQQQGVGRGWRGERGWDELAEGRSGGGCSTGGRASPWKGHSEWPDSMFSILGWPFIRNPGEPCWLITWGVCEFARDSAKHCANCLPFFWSVVKALW